MKATIKIHELTATQGVSVDRDVECAVRLGHQGYGSIEIEMGRTGLVTSTTPEYTWRTLGEVLSYPRVLGVTFRGQWGEPTDDRQAEHIDRKPIVR